MNFKIVKHPDGFYVVEYWQEATGNRAWYAPPAYVSESQSCETLDEVDAFCKMVLRNHFKTA